MSIDLTECFKYNFGKYPKAKYELHHNGNVIYIAVTTRIKEEVMVESILDKYPYYRNEGLTKIIKKDGTCSKTIYHSDFRKNCRNVVHLDTLIVYTNATEASEYTFMSHAQISKHCDPNTKIKEIRFMYLDIFKVQYPERIPFITYFKNQK